MHARGLWFRSLVLAIIPIDDCCIFLTSCVINERLGSISLRFALDLFAELTDEIYDGLPKTSIRHSQLPRHRGPVQRDVPKRRYFLLRREDFFSPPRKLPPNNLPYQVVIKLVRGTSHIPSIRDAGIQSESSLDVGERRVSDVYPVWRETTGELRRAVFATDDVPDFAVGVV